MEKDLVKLRSEIYDKVAEMYGDEYTWFKVDITICKKKPEIEGLSFSVDTDMMNVSKDWALLKGPNENNTGDMWDKSNAEKINS
jgi:hypothetical protein